VAAVALAVGLLGVGAPAASASTVTEFAVPTASSGPSGIAAGPDGALWFTELSANKIGRITTGGAVTEFAVPTASSFPEGIAAGPDGALWFTEANGNKIGRIAPDVAPPDPPGPSGPGVPGPAGPPGPLGLGVQDPALLEVAFGRNRYKAKRGRSLRLRYVATRASSVTVQALKGRKVIAKASARARKGRNSITLRRLRATGRFKLRLTAKVDNQTSTDTARLTVSRR